MTYPGGKAGAGVYQTIINLMPPHQTYIEPFAGGGAIIRAKRPAPLENIAIDLDAAAVDQLREQLRRRPDYPGAVYSVRCADGIEYLRTRQWTGQELVYCDPPYLMSTRRGRELYRFELADDQHRQLLELIRALPCNVIISGYASRLYSAALPSWHHRTFTAMTRGGRKATEHLWCNFEPAAELHDYAYVGTNFRERERIKRKKTRWVEKLRRMPAIERAALLSAIEEHRKEETP